MTGADERTIVTGTVRAVLHTVTGDETVKTVKFTDGRFALTCPATCRLIVASDGYAAQSKSILLDCDDLFVDLLWGIRRVQLLDPAFYKRIEKALDDVSLDFELARSSS